eukprot:TRINITY_DN2037_c0_g1_i1.p1 TRINITY_DN2037_c0_g1~~TRINITY_DN2037_c0_g1_i1.p1  ORF type:complete len:687 (-),score=162.89 TRINITY_DN2037_c0_g1_i1:847-2907(-)
MKSLFVFLALLAVSGIFVAKFTNEEAQRDSVGFRSGREPLSVVPLGSEKRLDFNGNSLGVGMCAPDANNNCDWPGYAQGIGRLSLAPFAFTFIVLLSFWVFCSGRLCCNCFGGKERTPGNICYGRMCCSTDCFVGRDFHGYATLELWIVKVALVLLVCALAASAIPGFRGNAKISEGIKGPTNNVGLFIRNISDSTTAIINELSTLEYSKDANASIDGLTNFTVTLTDLTDKANGYVKEADRYRRPVYITLIVLAPFFALIGLAAGFFNLPKLTCCIGLCLFWVSMIVWIVFSLQFFLVLVFEDGCTETTIWSANLANGGAVVPGSRQSIFEKYIPTSELNRTFTDLRKVALDAEALVIESGNNVIDQLCTNRTVPDPVFSAGEYCTTNRTHTPARFLGSPSANVTDIKTDNSDGCLNDGYYPCASFCCRIVTIQECSTKCAENQTRSAALDLVNFIDLFQKYDAILIGKVLPFLSFDTFLPLVVGLRDPICQGLVEGGQIVEQCLLCIAIFLIPTTILMIMAHKRWRDDSAGPSESTLELQPSKSGQSPTYITTPTMYAMNSDNEIMDMTAKSPPKEEAQPEEPKNDDEPQKEDPLLTMKLEDDDPKPRANTAKSGEIDFGLMDFGLQSNRGSMLPPDRDNNNDTSSVSSDSSDSDERLEMMPATPPPEADSEPGTPPSYDETFA